METYRQEDQLFAICNYCGEQVLLKDINNMSGGCNNCTNALEELSKIFYYKADIS